MVIWPHSLNNWKRKPAPAIDRTSDRPTRALLDNVPRDAPHFDDCGSSGSRQGSKPVRSLPRILPDVLEYQPTGHPLVHPSRLTSRMAHSTPPEYKNPRAHYSLRVNQYKCFWSNQSEENCHWCNLYVVWVFTDSQWRYSYFIAPLCVSLHDKSISTK